MEQHSQICPWCQTEIVWDPEFGKEDYCPHCANELKDYRTMSIDLEVEDDEMNDNLLSASYEEGAEAYIFAQEQSVECSHCRNTMIYTGQQEVSEKGIKLFIPQGMTEPFMKPPFTLNIWVCPSCFTLTYQLDERSKQRIISSIE